MYMDKYEPFIHKNHCFFILSIWMSDALKNGWLTRLIPADVSDDFIIFAN